MTLLAAGIVGALLALAGAVLQSLFRNPLAEPYMLGMVGGGALFSALAVVCGFTAAGAFVLPLASFAGSLFSLSLVLLVAGSAARLRARQGSDAALRSSSSTIVVAGFVVGSLMGSLDMLVLSFAQGEEFAALSKWLYGSLATITPFAVALGGVVLAGVCTVLAFYRKALTVMELGHDEAACLGVNTRQVMIVVVGAVALATSASVALAGAVGFVGLVVPHIARRLTGAKMQKLLPLSAGLGALFLMLAQALALRFTHLSIGIISAIVGAPFFLILLSTYGKGEGRDI